MELQDQHQEDILLVAAVVLLMLLLEYMELVEPEVVVKAVELVIHNLQEQEQLTPVVAAVEMEIMMLLLVLAVQV
jgi:hypothetical protein